MGKGFKKALLVALRSKKQDSIGFDPGIEEMQNLARTAGFQVLMTLIQAREQPHRSTYIGKGKLEELKHLIEEVEPELVIFNGELSPVQLRNLQESFEVRIIDRTMLILEIFGLQARTLEGKLQVELAELEYRLPRLVGKGRELSRIGGGIGARGMGEQKLELDRRHTRKRIREIKKQMQKVQKTRELHKKRRKRAGFKVVSLVGYTNAGKSSLFNTLCVAGHAKGTGQVVVGDRLFQTLDPTTRKIKLDSSFEVLITDTVGFIQNLPHYLVAAFRSTLEEAVEADLLLHVVDVADPQYLEKMMVVEGVLEELGANQENILTVFNKADKLGEEDIWQKNYISAHTGKGIEWLLNEIRQKLNG